MSVYVHVCVCVHMSVYILCLLIIDSQVSLKNKAIIGALKCVYWLAKEETAHHTKFNSLINLGKSLGCSYLSGILKELLCFGHQRVTIE